MPNKTTDVLSAMMSVPFLAKQEYHRAKTVNQGGESPQPIMADTFPFFHAFADFYTRLKMFYNGFAVLFLVLSGKSNNYWVMGIR